MDTTLIRRAQDGDQRAFDTLATGLVTRFHAIAYRVLQDPDLAQDATQQAFIGIWRDLPRLHDPVRFDGWAYRVLIHACYKEAGKRRRWLLRTSSTMTEEPSIADASDAVIERDRLARGFARLSVEQRAVVVLHPVGHPPPLLDDRHGAAWRDILRHRDRHATPADAASHGPAPPGSMADANLDQYDWTTPP